MQRAGAHGHGEGQRREGLVLSSGLGSRQIRTLSLQSNGEIRRILGLRTTRAFARWTTLTNAVSGLFCASLNFIDSTRTTRPRVTFEPTGDHSNASKLYLLHGTLPREVVCTENLTPFLKLLPCKGKAGISSLMDGHKLFDASWQSMAIDVRPLCSSDGLGCIIEMEQTVDMVLDIQRSKRPRGRFFQDPRGFC